jgi:hypothetical protein
MNYIERHEQAMRIPMRGHEGAIVTLLEGLKKYAKAHEDRFGSPISEDYILGPALESIAEGVRTLLNGETGRLDCGTLDTMLAEYLAKDGANT